MTKLSLGTKFIGVVLVSLALSFLTMVWNAAYLFRKDNLDSIYISSELLLSAKSGEVQSWVRALIRETGWINGILTVWDGHTGKRPSAPLSVSDELLWVAHYEPVNSNTFVLKASWWNQKKADSLSLPDARKSQVLTQFGPDSVAAKNRRTTLRARKLLDSVPVLLLQQTLPTGRVVVSGVLTPELNRIFGEAGPYEFGLVNAAGEVMAHRRPELIQTRLSGSPLVKRLLVSKATREVLEYSDSGKDRLGGFVRLGVADVFVINQVPKEIALEAGNILIERSIILALLVFSVVFIVAYIFVQGILAPIERLSQATQLLAAGDYSVRVDVQSGDEIADLATRFNQMGGEISRRIEQLSEINDASHQIVRTLEPGELVEFSSTFLAALLECPSSGGVYVSKEGKRVESRRGESLPSWEMLSSKEGGSFEWEGKQWLLSPIMEKSERRGSIVIGGRDAPFRKDDPNLVGTVLATVGATYENIRLIRETADKARLDKELETARHVQNTMFPPTSIRIGNLELQSYYSPASECGGDWWGCVELPGGRVMVAIGDATGHGVPAAMITATAKASCSVLSGLASASSTLASSPRALMHLLNKAVFEATQGQIQMTFFIAIFDSITGEVVFSSASHDPVYWYRQGDETMDILMSEQGPRLGQDPVSYFENESQKLAPGDVVVLYTDGIPEGKNPTDEEWGESKFVRSLKKHVQESPEEMRESVLGDFRKFTDGHPLEDDVTLVVCKFHPVA